MAGRDFDKFPRRPQLGRKFGQSHLDLAANDVIRALDGNISREEALAVGMAVLVGYGHEFSPTMHKRNHRRIQRLPGGPPRIGLRKREPR
jgi:hypothetical protein